LNVLNFQRVFNFAFAVDAGQSADSIAINADG